MAGMGGDVALCAQCQGQGKAWLGGWIGGRKWFWLVGYRFVVSQTGFLSEQKLGCAEVRELGKALSTWGRPRLARTSAKEIINP